MRTVRGTLSVVIGKDGLALDRLSRRIGFRRAAVAQLPTMRREVRLQLDAYVLDAPYPRQHARGKNTVASGCARRVRKRRRALG